jgi:hypothetical protein
MRPWRSWRRIVVCAALAWAAPGCVVVDASRWPLAVRRADPRPPAPTPTLGPIEPPPGEPPAPKAAPDSAVDPRPRRRFASWRPAR